MSLDYFGRMAKDHWEKFLPKYYKKLEKSGKLEETLMKASNNYRDMASELISSGLRKHEADEFALPQYILLTPESQQEEKRGAMGDEEEWETVSNLRAPSVLDLDDDPSF
jgi:hypothetical protein